MIRTVADFLEALMEKEREKLPEYKDIKHPGIFGEMYEGLAQELLKRALFNGIDIRVVRGKVRNSRGNLSGEIDCMIVLGDGEPIPHTQKFIYPFEKVVMIVEIKKTLYGEQLKEAMNLFRHFWKEVAEVRPPQSGLVEDAWRALFRANLPSAEQVDALPFHEQLIRHTLLTEALLPLRVVFGYEGYVDEFGLREGFIGYLEEIVSLPFEGRPRFNLNTFPNLVVCGKASLIKLDGMPYSGTLDSMGFWWFIGSRRSEPFLGLLELLWTRLAYVFKLGPEIFGEDLEIEAVSPLLAAKAEKIGDQAGWQYKNLPVTREELRQGSDWRSWHPPELTLTEFSIVNVLCKQGEIDITDPEFVSYLAKQSQPVTSLCDSLNEKALTTLNGNKLVLITDECACMILPDGRYVAAENKSGRLLRYGLKVTEERRRQRAKEAGSKS
ncbi:MAG: DUF6602 domain-containing protein [Verrucomicrobiia bacterium]|jgi:hypothetical protein